MRRRPWLSPLMLLAVVACRPAGAASSAETILAAALPGLLEQPLSQACGPLLVPARPTRLLLVTAKHCLSCRSMGLVMRRLALHAPATLAVFVPARDAEAVCAFARQERIDLPIVPLSGKTFPAGALHDRFLYGVVDAQGTILLARLAMEAHDFFADSSGDAAYRATGTSPH
jgi:hypothetical protein